MAEQAIRFDDGAAYEQMMGLWSREAGAVFLDWVQPPRGLAWLDVGCGNGAFTQMLIDRCAPATIAGVDPSPGQLSYARKRCPAAQFETGDAMALPFADNTVDAATMALVIFFVPEPARGVAEMARVVRPGGIVAAYAWDMLGGGFPHHPLQAELREMGKNPLLPPSAEASRLDALQSLWTGAGLQAVETRSITVRRSFENFETYWQASAEGPGFKPAFAAMDPKTLDGFKERVRARLSADEAGRITCEARANAVKGRVPG